MSEQPFDVRKVIEQSAAKTTLQELARKGIHKVKVLDEKTITQLIHDAVQQIVGSKSGILPQGEREKLVAQSRMELDKLIKEFNQAKDKAELLAQDKDTLAAEVENLQRQMQLQRQISDQAGKTAVEDAHRLAKDEIDVLHKQLDIARQELDLARLSLQANANQDLQRKEAEFNEKLMAEMRKNVELSEKLSRVLEDGRTRDDEIAKKMEALFNKSIEGLSKKLSDLRLRAAAAGGGAEPGAPGEEFFRQSSEVISQMLGKELESNVKAMEPTEGKTAGKLGSALERLKAMRGAPRKEENK